MTKRKSLSKKLRFDVFKRDLFCCKYCGNHPPNVILEVDHIIPVSKSGSNEIDNLITSCFDCNRGKSDGLLEYIPLATDEKLSILKERELQYRAYKRLILSIDKRLNKEVEVVNEAYSSYYPYKEFTEQFKSSVKYFLKLLGLQNVLNALDVSAMRMDNSRDTLQYFCGICWNMIKNNKKTVYEK